MTFLSTVARHIVPLLSQSHNPIVDTRHRETPEPTFGILLSSANGSGAPAQSPWLVEKFATPHGEPMYEDGVVIESVHISGGSQVPDPSHLGLVVFEAPMVSDGEDEIAQ
jgi:hypothetical protein